MSIEGRSNTPGLDLSDPALLQEILLYAPTPMVLVEGTGYRCVFANMAARALGAVEGLALPSSFPTAAFEVLAEVRRTGEARRVRAGSADQRLWDVDVTAVRGALLLSAREAVADSAAVDQQLREVSHRVKNTLQLVSSLMTLQTLSAKDPALRRAFQEACGRIGTVTQAHQRIHTANRGDKVDFAAYLRDACAEMESGMAAQGKTGRIVPSVNDAMLPVDVIIPLALIVNELIGNAIRHAYPSDPRGGDQGGDVEVSLQPIPEGGRRLIIADHGRGLPPGFELARADSLGMKVARAFASQLKGKLRAEANNPGTCFVLDLPF